MGACGSTEAAGADGTTAEAVQRSKVIDRMLREDEQRAAKEVKMLLLGPGASGKSTILKQMKLIHLSGFTPTEIESYRQQIFVNVREGMRMCFMILEDEGAELQDPSLIDYREPIESAYDLRDSEPFPVKLLQPLKALWADKGMQKVAAVASEAELPENIPYFFAQLDRLFDPAYVPTEQDILRCRQKTTGITETIFSERGLQYRIFDVGGQRSERKKWIHCFESVTAIIFLASLAGYDQVLIEDRDSNQMQEALMLFDSICNSQWFVNTSMILFLNKVDVFRERIFVSHVKAHFPDYIGPELDAQAAQEFFKSRFTRLNRSARKEIYTHYTTAIDTSLVKVVMTSVYDIILNRNLQDFIL
ncbi:guanine nucleotide-binding protein subunit alpha [Rhodotorula paludigena]|uniref:guanine nucleotide-binding protein subunit alpha n=1 Tax=Rhodotorula paludigena TaxID=86838 RepID=UPI00317A46E3